MSRARCAADLAARQAVGGGFDHLEFGDGGVAEAGDLGEPPRRRGDRLGERAELADQRLGEGLHVAPRHGTEQHQLEELVVGHRIAARLAEAGAKAFAMPVIVRRSLLETGLRTVLATLARHVVPSALRPIIVASMTTTGDRLQSP